MRKVNEKVLLLENAFLVLDDVVEGRVVIFQIRVGLDVIAEQDGYAQHTGDWMGGQRAQ